MSKEDLQGLRPTQKILLGFLKKIVNEKFMQKHEGVEQENPPIGILKQILRFSRIFMSKIAFLPMTINSFQFQQPSIFQSRVTCYW
jgi:hypothetical protein